MRKILGCRRSVIALVAIAACVVISKMTNADTSGAIAMIAIGLAGANSAEAFSNKGVKNESKI